MLLNEHLLESIGIAIYPSYLSQYIGELIESGLHLFLLGLQISLYGSVIKSEEGSASSLYIALLTGLEDRRVVL